MNKLLLLFCLVTLMHAGTVCAAEAAAAAEPPKGPHGGRLLSDGDFSVELAIFEDGVEPEYHAWATSGGNELGLQEWQLDVELQRLGGRVDRFTFLPADGFLRGQGVVEEPHSFDVTVSARHAGTTHRWQFESYEGRAHIDSTLAARLNIGTAVAGAGTLHQTALLYGKTVPDPQGVSHVTARFPGLIRSIAADLGDHVDRGDRLVVVEANSSLQQYTITAPISGTVVQRHANAGEFAGDQPLMTIADYSRVWVDFDVFPADAGRIHPQQPVAIRMGELTATSSIGYLNPGEGTSPNVVARVPLDNADGRWTPGLLVEGSVVVADIDVPLVVDNRALQSFRDWQVVFVKVGDNYEIRPLTLGRTDGHVTEVLAGLEAGSEYVVLNSYLLKADVEKAGASHDH